MSASWYSECFDRVFVYQVQFCIMGEVYCHYMFMFLHEGIKPAALSAYLEITDVVNRHLRYIPVPAYVCHSVILIIILVNCVIFVFERCQ